MKQRQLQVYAFCSSGTDTNPEPEYFANELDKLRQNGVEVQRFDYLSDSTTFTQNETVQKALKAEGDNCLPLIIVNGAIVSRSIYPSPTELRKFAGISEAIEQELPDEHPVSFPPPTKNEKTGTRKPIGTTKTIAVTSICALLAVVVIFILKASSGQMIGTQLQSVLALDEVALNQNVVIVYAPGKGNKLADSKTVSAVLAAKKTLEAKGVPLDVFTLRTSSPDYIRISLTVPLPAILVATKGKQMATVTGDVTEDKIMQAYATITKAGDCGGPAMTCSVGSPGCEGGYCLTAGK